jgi:hypothetical protein
VNVRGAIGMKPNKWVGLRCRLTQATENGQGIDFYFAILKLKIAVLTGYLRDINHEYLGK